MKNFKKYIPGIILILSVIIGAFFRFYRIGQTPIGLYQDEAAIGYNAYSILKTGKDEFGKYSPVLFRSFTTFQSPIYTYLLVPLISLLGLTPLVVRFPSALLGTLTIPLLFLLVKKLSFKKYGSKLAVISALFLAISPWHILYSRTAYETNIALFFLILGTLFFFYSIKKPWLFILSSISFAFSITAYRAEIFVVPVLLFILFLRFYKTISKKLYIYTHPILISIVVGFALMVPTFLLIRTPGYQSRTSALNIFSFQQQKPWGYRVDEGNLSKLINNPQLLSIKEFISLYASYFSPRYIFSLGDSGPRMPFPDLGTFFVWQFPLYLLGLYFLIKESGLKSLKYFNFVLLFASPIPAALTRDPYSTIRSLPMVIPLTVILSFGLVKLLDFTWPILNKVKYLVIVLLILYSSIRMFISIAYLNDYYSSKYWDYGWQQVTESLAYLDPKLPILVDSTRSHPYILLLFFLKYDPAAYQKDNFEVPLSEYYTNMTSNSTKFLGRITTKKFVWGVDTDRIEKYIVVDALAISDQQIKEHNMKKVVKIDFPNGTTALNIIKTNPQP